LFEETIRYFSEKPNITMLILPRYDSQTQEIKSRYAELVKNKTMIVPEKVFDGLNLIWYSDFVVSGGGTMNREAAALGVPVYSIFRGKIGAVDNYLSRSGRLVLLESVEDVRKKIKVEKRNRPEHPGKMDNKTLESVVGTISALLNGIGK
jgi:predicted glycosyltransferase